MISSTLCGIVNVFPVEGCGISDVSDVTSNSIEFNSIGLIPDSKVLLKIKLGAWRISSL
jgi:hypothetical protein